MRGQLLAQLLAQLVVEIGERLVEQHELGALDERAGNRRALLLPAGELERRAIEMRLEPQEPRGLSNPALDLGAAAGPRRATARRCSRRRSAKGS